MYRDTGYSSGCISQLSRFTSLICRLSVILQRTFTGLPLRSGCSRSICPTSVNDALCRENGSGRVIHKVEIFRSPKSRLLRLSTAPPKTNHLSKYPSISLIASVSVCLRDKWSKYSGVISVSKIRPSGSVCVAFVGVAGVYAATEDLYPASKLFFAKKAPKRIVNALMERVINKTKSAYLQVAGRWKCGSESCLSGSLLAFTRSGVPSAGNEGRAATKLKIIPEIKSATPALQRAAAAI